MDPITHTLAGATFARAGLDRRTPLAAATLMIAANAPDIDVAALFVGPYASLEYRRGWTHGPIAILALPLVITATILAWDRWHRRRRDPSLPPANGGAVLLLAAIGVVSHPLLDWLNIYGVRLLSPLSGRWFHGDAAFIVDPWLWLLLGGGLWLARRRQSDPSRALRTVRTAGTGAAAYVLALIAASAAGERVARRAAEGQGIAGIAQVVYSPAPANPFAADLLVVTAGGYRFGRLRWLGGERVRFERDRDIPRGDWSLPVVRRAMEEGNVRRYLAWSQLPYVQVGTPASAGAGGTVVRFGDARFAGFPGAGGLQGVSVTVPVLPR